MLMETANLNAEQAAAVQHIRGPLVVYAGAGSGKTRVITHRVAQIVRGGHAPPYRILAVTFTNKAAQEMRERLGCQLGEEARDVWIGTFHATCAKLLRIHAAAAGLSPRFVIYDDADQRALITRIQRDLNISERRLPVKVVAGKINRARQELIEPDDMPVEDAQSELVRRIYSHYQRMLAQAGALDFDELIYRVVKAAQQHEAFRQEVTQRFNYVLVDEFQDTNQVQLKFVELLVERHRNLCVVGDDDQSIYRWRGADRRNILLFQNYFPEARVVKLEQNYRSSQRILRAAHAIISHNVGREEKKLWTQNEEGSPVAVVRCQDERHEAMALVRGVRQLSDEYPLSDIAVFYRIHAQSRVLEEALRSGNVPYRIVGGTRFYDRAEIKDLLAYLRAITNSNDDVSLLRIINTPTRGIGAKTIERLLSHAAARGTGVWDVLADVKQLTELTGGTKNKLLQFKKMLEDLRKEAAIKGPSELAEHVLRQSGYSAMLEQEDSVEADARLQNLQELLGSIGDFEKENANTSLSDFLENVTLSTKEDELSNVEERISLMTVHAAKGLEFPVVFVSGMEERLFPYKGTEVFDDPEELEEERRLAYVALTRAKEHLVLTYAVSRRLFGKLRVEHPSRFLNNIPPSDITEVELVQSPRMPTPRPPPQGSHRSSSSESYVEPTHDGQSAYSGMRVQHPSFGEGVIRSVEDGAPPRATVDFGASGVKRIVVSYLQPL